jgi:phosphoribosylanthranilate isomerase
VRVEVKVCGLTQPADSRAAAELGARYVGVIFAGGPRRLDAARARDVLDAAGAAVQRVGVFGGSEPSEIARTIREARLDIAQLHDDPSVDDVRAVRDASGAKIWAVVRVKGALSVSELHALWAAADALVLDSKLSGMLGGTGSPFDWIAARAATADHAAPLVVAGGLTAANVARAIEALSPNIVDVSSGVESSPGIKDRSRISDFMDAVNRAGSAE